MPRVWRLVVEKASKTRNMFGATVLRLAVRFDKLYFKKKSSLTVFFLFCSTSDWVTPSDSQWTVFATSNVAKSSTSACAVVLYFEFVQ